jgi:uncharacterized phage protein gp47/JayE
MSETKYGLTAQGFKRKRLTDIVKSINSRLSDSLGTSIQTSSNSVFGQLVGVFSFEIADLWEQLENSYNAMYPSTAQGTSLSNAAGLAGLQLIEAESTTLIATCFGSELTEIPYNAQITDGTYTYSCIDVYQEITAGRCSVVGFKINGSVTDGTTYSITIDGETYSYTATSTDDASSVFIALAAQSTFTDRTFNVTSDALLITMTDQSQTMNAINTANTLITVIGSPFTFRCDTAGAITPALGSVNQIVTSYAGWDSVENNVAAATGRDAETDISLRERWAKSIYHRASGMTEAITAALYDVDGVSFARTFENNTDATDADGRPPHSIEAVVQGGAVQDILDTIWRVHAGGITTYGSISGTVYDSQNVSHTVSFNRPTIVPIYLQISVTENPEKELSAAAVSLIKSAVVNVFAGLTVGQDVILQSLYGAIYTATSGAVGYMQIQGSTDDSTFTTYNITIDSRSLATIDAANIDVTINT